jgi:hypothetical protein
VGKPSRSQTCAGVALLLASLPFAASAQNSSTAKTASTAKIMRAYAAKTEAGIRCPTTKVAGEVVVCRAREADHYRVPLIQTDPGDPRNETVMQERNRLIAPRNNCAEKSLFLVGCGAVGVTASTQSGVHTVGERPLAP